MFVQLQYEKIEVMLLLHLIFTTKNIYSVMQTFLDQNLRTELGIQIISLQMIPTI